ncbi:helicase [Cenarchaeum symbiosum A]|uniref:Helicase n=1 Tax=Cenarchaeum symbiosum (strain A) TaxID=414004 RepID=A0RTX5_CENSY|nr:helicase [Cenarchaeum symbiosum A]
MQSPPKISHTQQSGFQLVFRHLPIDGIIHVYRILESSGHPIRGFGRGILFYQYVPRIFSLGTKPALIPKELLTTRSHHPHGLWHYPAAQGACLCDRARKGIRVHDAGKWQAHRRTRVSHVGTVSRSGSLPESRENEPGGGLGMPDFASFFTTATKHPRGPFPYQEKLAYTSFGEIPDTLILPAGSGRTEAAVLSLWLWRIYCREPGIPRRLVYCLPSGALVEQIASRARGWLWNLKWNKKVDVRYFMGGSEGYASNIDLAKPCIMIGTQDILLSGALNHMYGQRAGIFPVAAAMLNNDSIWIMDEAQTMGAGLGTSLQLDTFRRICGTFGPSKSVWISAIAGALGTIDNPGKNRAVFRPGEEDLRGELGRRVNAARTIRRIDLPTRDGMYTEADAKKMLGLREGGSMAIILNTIDRAQRLYSMVKKSVTGRTWCVLVHPGFRPGDRAKLSHEIQGIGEDADGVVISTQALETGVDLSVRTIVAELAPWPSMVKRIGRCRGDGKAAAYWIDLDSNSYQPYGPGDGQAYDRMDRSREVLEGMEGSAVSGTRLAEVPAYNAIYGAISREQLEELFDTTQDILGSPVDVSRHTGDGDPGALVFWSDAERRAKWNDLCGMNLEELRGFVSEHASLCSYWNPKSMSWGEIGAGDVYPGIIVRIEPAAGGYTQELGLWTGYDGPVKEAVLPARLDRQDGRDVTLRDHTRNIADAAGEILSGLGVDAEYSGAVRTAAQWHDVGKMHYIFQEYLRPNLASGIDEIWAKSGRKERDKTREERRSYGRRGFKHEVASALAFMNSHDGPEHDLVAYLIMSHHGLVRLEMHPKDDGMVSGIVDGEPLCERAYAVHDNVMIPAGLVLDASAYGAGGRRPWRERTAALLKRHGPFRLSYLETVLRKADWAASAKDDER